MQFSFIFTEIVFFLMIIPFFFFFFSAISYNYVQCSILFSFKAELCLKWRQGQSDTSWSLYGAVASRLFTKLRLRGVAFSLGRMS